MGMSNHWQSNDNIKHSNDNHSFAHSKFRRNPCNITKIDSQLLKLAPKDEGGLGLCGGLNDRVGQLPWDLYLANQTPRVLLLHWHRPVPIENFFIPSELDWTVPNTGSLPGFFPARNQRTVSREGMRKVRAYEELFAGYESDRPEKVFWEEHLDLALDRANHGAFRDTKILRHRILGHLNEDVLEKRLRALGETDMLHQTRSFGDVFWMFFRPSTIVQRKVDNAYRELNLTTGISYHAVHCRVRHPKAVRKNIAIVGKNEDYPADKSGLPWFGETRSLAISTATHALRCASTLLDDRTEPIYFYSDSNDLVEYMAHDLNDAVFLRRNPSLFETSDVDKAALSVVRDTRVMARNVSLENAHIDKQKGRDVEAYVSTFVDLFLATNARCVTFGIGYYALLATKISGITCALVYQEEAWGGSESKGRDYQKCAVP